MDNKMKKVGLTALAGSLAATTGYAADMSVSGSWSVSYDTNDTSVVTGNPLTLGDSITFSASGETDQGWTVGMSYELDYGGVLDDLKATLDMGDAGKFTFGESAGGSGLELLRTSFQQLILQFTQCQQQQLLMVYLEVLIKLVISVTIYLWVI